MPQAILSRYSSPASSPSSVRLEMQPISSSAEGVSVQFRLIYSLWIFTPRLAQPQASDIAAVSPICRVASYSFTRVYLPHAPVLTPIASPSSHVLRDYADPAGVADFGIAGRPHCDGGAALSHGGDDALIVHGADGAVV